jgi:NAD(P)-dependent dehydrogenase (short-subunit alcohol dehydrogenase family)
MKSANPPIRDWRGKSVWVLGASSGIGLATAEHLARAGARLIVSARNAAALDEFCQRHPGALALPLDVTDDASIGQTFDALCRHLDAHARTLDLVMYCVGHYRPMQARQLDLQQLRLHIDINYLGALRVLEQVVPHLLAQGKGHLSLVASVAGYRGLPRALAYGPTKAALISLAQTLHHDLAPLGLGVSVINPGFVATGLTAQNDFEMPALQTPDQAALAILHGWADGRFDIHFPRRFSRIVKGLALLGLLSDRLAFTIIRRITAPTKQP